MKGCESFRYKGKLKGELVRIKIQPGVKVQATKKKGQTGVLELTKTKSQRETEQIKFKYSFEEVALKNWKGKKKNKSLFANSALLGYIYLRLPGKHTIATTEEMSENRAASCVPRVAPPAHRIFCFLLKQAPSDFRGAHCAGRGLLAMLPCFHFAWDSTIFIKIRIRGGWLPTGINKRTADAFCL